MCVCRATTVSVVDWGSQTYRGSLVGPSLHKVPVTWSVCVRVGPVRVWLLGTYNDSAVSCPVNTSEDNPQFTSQLSGAQTAIWPSPTLLSGVLTFAVQYISTEQYYCVDDGYQSTKHVLLCTSYNSISELESK